jgi:DNA gyrase subunit A
VYQLPEAARTSKGRAIMNLLPLEENEVVTDVLRVQSFDNESAVLFATRSGTVKKTMLEAYSRPKRNGIRAILLAEDDEVVGVGLVRPGDTVMLASAGGRAIRFDEAAARAMGRTSRGVRGIRLAPGDRVIGMLVAHDPEATVVTVSEHGYGKRTPLPDYPIKGRGGQGVINIKCTERNGEVVQIALADEPDHLIFISESGMIVRSEASEMRPMGRNTQGVRLVNLKSEDRVVGLGVVSEEDLASSEGDELAAGGDGLEHGAAPDDADPDEPDDEQDEQDEQNEEE